MESASDLQVDFVLLSDLRLIAESIGNLIASSMYLYLETDVSSVRFKLDFNEIIIFWCEAIIFFWFDHKYAIFNVLNSIIECLCMIYKVIVLNVPWAENDIDGYNHQIKYFIYWNSLHQWNNGIWLNAIWSYLYW